MKNKTILLGVILAASVMLATAVFAAQDTLNWGIELNPDQCGAVGKPVINVVEKIVNTVDSGEGGNYWAYDNLNRQIQVWDQGDGTYCAIVRNEGKFDGQAGQTSPGAGGTMTGDEDGPFEGGYRAIIDGDLRTDPAWKNRGFVGTNNYNCDLTGDCPDYVNWVEQYFDSGYSFTYDWWGWIYHGGKCGTWVNSADGNAGDILCS